MVFENDLNENIAVYELDQSNTELVFRVKPTDMTLIWNVGGPMDISIDRTSYRLDPNQVIFLTEFHRIDSIALESARMVRFNQPFFCIVNHDSEVGCKGFLFFGASGIPIISVDESMLREFEVSWESFQTEMRQHDILKKDMLQAILKRLLILSARIRRKSTRFYQLEKNQSDIIREFNFLVEKHFARHHDVAFYAAQLNKSPKTLSNLFSIVSERTPLHIIHDRIMSHARRQLNYTGLSVKEIAYELGFDDIQTFSRFFKNKEGVSPLQYRGKSSSSALQQGKMANPPGIAA